MAWNADISHDCQALAVISTSRDPHTSTHASSGPPSVFRILFASVQEAAYAELG